MYSSEDFERLFIRYKGEAYLRGESIQTFCHRNNVPYNLFEKWYKDTRHCVEKLFFKTDWIDTLRINFMHLPLRKAIKFLTQLGLGHSKVPFQRGMP